MAMRYGRGRIREGSALVSDGGGAVYDLIAKKKKRIHLGYWTHARRYFVEAEEALPKESTSLNL
ncbi:MAG: hypothetical protein VB124_02105 [Burkholderia sp.]